MESVIKWQTGEPNMEGEYLITRTDRDTTCDVWAILEHYQYWEHHRYDEVVAWCPLSDIEPYKE